MLVMWAAAAVCFAWYAATAASEVTYVTLADGRPQWKEGHCELCFACLHHCPHHAIAFGKHSLRNGQYVCPRKG